MACQPVHDGEPASDNLRNADRGATALAEVFTPKVLAEHLRLFMRHGAQSRTHFETLRVPQLRRDL